MTKIKKFLRSLKNFIQLSQAGFYFTELTHKDNDGTLWGFYRFNYERENVSIYSIFDIDFSEKGHEYFYHTHGGINKDETLFRVDKMNGKIKTRP